MKYPILILLLLYGSGLLVSFRSLNPPPPSNDACASATVIDITGGGFDYGDYTSSTSDMTTATAKAGEFFQFAPGHNKSVWFSFTIPTRRSATIEMAVATGSVITNPGDAGVTVYLSPTCVQGSAAKLGDVQHKQAMC